MAKLPNKTFDTKSTKQKRHSYAPFQKNDLFYIRKTTPNLMADSKAPDLNSEQMKVTVNGSINKITTSKLKPEVKILYNEKTKLKKDFIGIQPGTISQAKKNIKSATQSKPVASPKPAPVDVSRNIKNIKQAQKPKKNINKDTVLGPNRNSNLSNGDTLSKVKLPATKSPKKKKTVKQAFTNPIKEKEALNIKTKKDIKKNSENLEKKAKTQLKNKKRKLSSENLKEMETSKKRKIAESSDSESENYLDQFFSDVEDFHSINDSVTNATTSESSEGDEGDSDTNENCLPLEDLVKVYQSKSFRSVKKHKKIKNLDKSVWLEESISPERKKLPDNLEVVPYSPPEDVSSLTAESEATDCTHDSDCSIDTSNLFSESENDSFESGDSSDDYFEDEDDFLSIDSSDDNEDVFDTYEDNFEHGEDEWVTDSDDEDYSQTSCEDDLYIRRGEAKIYEVDDNNVSSFISFNDSDSPQIREIVQEPEGTKKNNTFAEGESNDEDNDSCPDLVPIDYDNLTAVDYDDDDWVTGSEESMTSEDEDSGSCTDGDEHSCDNSNDDDEDALEPEEEEKEENVVDEKMKTEKDEDAILLTQMSTEEGSIIENIFIPFQDNKRVLLLLNKDIYFNGILKITPITSNVISYGYVFPIGETQICYSAIGHTAANISKIDSPNSKSEYKKFLDNHRMEFNQEDFLFAIENITLINDNAALILEREDGNKKLDMVSKYFDASLFPKIKKFSSQMKLFPYENILQAKFYSYETCTMPLNVLHEWEELKLKSNTKIVLAGGKSTGKSTTLQYMINKNLRNFDKILLIDLDIGQPLKFLPQTISVTLIGSPILGLSYFETTQPDKAILFGDSNAQIAPNEYFQCVKQLLDYCKQCECYKGIPWLINTMGYNQGLGTELMAILLKLIEPTDLIQLQHTAQSFNFQYCLTSDYVNNLKFNLFVEENRRLNKVACNHELHQWPAYLSTTKIKSLQMSAEKNRVLRIIIHLSNCLSEYCQTLNEVVPFQ